LASWRRFTVAAARCIAAVRSPVIIPMAFSNAEYLEEIRTGLARSGRPFLHFCLTASLDVIRQRLTDRGEPIGEARWAWVHRRAAGCCLAQQSESFATLVATASRPAAAVAADLAGRVRGARTAC